MKKTLSLLFAVVSPALICAQVIGHNKEAGKDEYTLSVRAQLVIETVAVKDKAGHPIQGLTAQDFTLTEEGAPQKIRFCEHQTFSASATPLPVLSQKEEKVQIFKKLSRSDITPDSSEILRYRNRRLMALYFDMSAMGQAEQYRALHAATNFVREHMTADDLVSIMRYSNGSVDVLQDFTEDRNRLLSILDTMLVGEDQEWATGESNEGTEDNGAAFGQDDSEFNIFNTDRQLSALQTAANMLGRLSEKKALIYFAGGLRLNGVDNQAQLHATVDAAIRAGVSFWPIDARGLVAEAPLGDATKASQGGIAMYTGMAAQTMQAQFQQSQDTLYALGADTGGKALLDVNDLSRGITQAQHSISDYYILSYYTTNTTPDGRFRHIKLTVNRPDAASLDYRQGYYAGKEFKKFTEADRERQLEDALMLEDPITELTIAMELDYFQLNSAEYFVPIIVKIPGRELALAKHRGASHTQLDFIGEIKDVYGGITLTNIRDHMDIKLTEKTEAELARVPIEYDAGFTLLPGKYRLKFLARDDETGRIGTYETVFTIPNLNKEEQHVPISSVVLSSQRVPLQDALFNAMKSKDQAKEAAVNPLVSEGKKLIPSVTRVFNNKKTLYVYLEAYQSGPDPAKPLIGYVSLYHGQSRAFSSQPVAITPEGTVKLKSAPLSFGVNLGDLSPGEYDCQISILDPTKDKSTFWRAPIIVIP